MYKKLLAAHDCEQWQALDEPYFIQGAIQLSLARNAPEFLPEIIGFNLGYEQLPLHLLICAYELKEIGIDPYYFTLHVTIDNAASGHAARAVKAVTDTLPDAGDSEAFYRRVCKGYQLSSAGIGSAEVITDFDLERELFNILASKASVGAPLHSDYCRVAGKTVTEWLSAPGQIQNFVTALEKIGWIRRHQHPDNSRFWDLIAGEKAPMFGVFNTYEQQVIYDWIAGSKLHEFSQHNGDHTGGEGRFHPCHDVAADELLRGQLSKAADTGAAMDMLVHWLSPAHHHTEIGLRATRMFAQELRS